MTSYRIASGARIDRGRPLRFTFDGRTYMGFAGDTLASALLANGVRLFGRSFKYHRPRGVLAAGYEEPNALVTVTSDGAREPNIRATELEIYDGLVAESQNRFPSLAFDLMAALLAVASLLSMALFYRPFDAGASDWFGVELRIVLALMWIAICLVLAHLSTLLAKRIRSITQVEPQ